MWCRAISCVKCQWSDIVRVIVSVVTDGVAGNRDSVSVVYVMDV